MPSRIGVPSRTYLLMGDYKTARSRLQAICNHVFTKKWKYAEELIATAVSPRPPTRARR